MHMVDNKTSRLGSFTTNVFTHWWLVTKEEDWHIFKDSRQSTRILMVLYSTFLVLIPKENHASDPTKFMAISLCNVIYKIISKIVANCIKPILPNLIYSEKMWNVEGQIFLDEIILVRELIHSLKISKNLGMLLKLDMSKVFGKLN